MAERLGDVAGGALYTKLIRQLKSEFMVMYSIQHQPGTSEADSLRVESEDSSLMLDDPEDHEDTLC
eukprot:1507375-Prorocentrum_lima.AAC.1